MQKKLKYLIVSLIVVGLSFGSNAQEILEAKKANFQTCFKEVRCSKLDSAQHDLQTIPFLKEEIESISIPKWYDYERIMYILSF